MSESNKNLVGAIASYVRANRDYNLGAFLVGYTGLSEREGRVMGLIELPRCDCGGSTVYHADSSDDGGELVTCSTCQKVGYL